MSYGLYLRLCFMMFLQYAVWGIWLPMIARFMDDRARGGIGLTPEEQGWIYTVYGFGAILGPPIVGQLADRFFATERVMAVCHFLGGILLLMAAYTTSFWPLFGLLFVYCNLYMPTMGLSNSITFRNLPESDQSLFPKIRVWGTYGWVVAGILFALYLDSQSLEFFRPFYEVLGFSSTFPRHLESWREFSGPILRPVFDLVGEPSFKDVLRIPGVLSFVLAAFCLALPHTPPIPAKATDPADKRNALVESLELMKNRSFAVLVIITGLIGIMLAFYFGCENYFLAGIGTNPNHTGAYMTIGQIAEVVVMYLVPLSIARLGFKRTMIIGATAWAIRFGLSAMGQPWWLMISSIALHGFAFGFFFVPAQMYVDKAASPDIKASAQNLLIFVIYGLGTILGSILTGYIRGYFSRQVAGPTGELVTQTNWTGVWAGPTVLTVICILAFIALFRETRITKAGPTDPLVG